MAFSKFPITFFLILISLQAIAQQSEGGLPYSLQENTTPLQHAPEPVVLTAPDIQQLEAEDRLRSGAPRFAAPADVDFTLQNKGQWEQLPNGDRLWRLSVASPGALNLTFLFEQFYLPPGSTLHVYNADKSHVLGAFTHKNNNLKRVFVVPLVRGDRCTLEYYEPAAEKGKGSFHIFKVYHAYTTPTDPFVSGDERGISADTTLGFGKSLACNINVRCPQGNSLQNQRKGVARIFMVMLQGLTGYCTGSLINNTKNDGKPLFLTAFHCQDGFQPLFDYWLFDFNYESPGCTNPATEPAFPYIIGAIPLAGRRESDFLLLHLAVNQVPPSYGVYFSGWSRDSVALPTRTSLIHHPKGDIKKITLDNQPAIINNLTINWNNNVTTPPQQHLTVVFDEGTFEIGSSGGPVFDQNGRIVGQIHGGNVNGCVVTNAYIGRIAKSWEGNGTPTSRLKDWLDPMNSGVLTLNGYDPPDTLPFFTLGGYFVTESGRGIAGVKVFVASDSLARTVRTDTSGLYVFDSLPSRFRYNITALKDTLGDNGVSTFDMVNVRKHILGVDTLPTAYKMIAADANKSNNVSTVDMVEMRKVILKINPLFPGNLSWRFIPTVFKFADPKNPFSQTIPEGVTLTNPNGDLVQLDWIGVKVGDVNDSVDPKK